MASFICPLCGDPLKEKLTRETSDGYAEYLEMLCSRKFEWETTYGTIIKSHYLLEKIVFYTEVFYLPPFNIVNFNEKSISRIYKLYEQLTDLPEGGAMNTKSWRFVAQVPLIKPDLEDKMLERVNLLLKFL